MSVSPPATPPSANIKVLTTKNQLLQKVETDVTRLLSQLEYSTMNKEYRNISEVKVEIGKAVKTLKTQALPGKVTEITEESLAKDISKGKLGDKEAAAKLVETLQNKKQAVVTAQEKVDKLEKELRTLKEQQAKNNEKSKKLKELDAKITKATAEREAAIKKAEEDIKVIEQQQTLLEPGVYATKHKAATDKLNGLKAELIEYKANSARNKEQTEASLTIDKKIDETVKDKETELEEAKTARDKATAAVKEVESKIANSKKQKTQANDKLLEAQEKTADTLVPPEKYIPDVTSPRYKSHILNFNNELLKKAEGKKGGAGETLGELLREYKMKLFLEEAEIKALQKAFDEFITNFNTNYNEIFKNLMDDPKKQTSLNLVWKLNGFNKVFPGISLPPPPATRLTPSSSSVETNYITKLFEPYTNALKAEKDEITKANPAFTEQQVKEELEKHIKGNLSPADKKAMGLTGPSGTAPGQGPLGTTGDGSGTDPQESRDDSSPSTLGSVVGKGLMDGFNILYTIFGALGAVLVLGTFFLSTIDILKFSVLEVWQYVMLFINPNMFNKDTLDFSTLLYAKNSEKDEPYTIFLQQEFISFMFKLVTYFVNTVILQIGIFMVLKVLKSLGKVEFEEGLDFGPAKKAIGVMVITIASAFIQNTYYNTTFLNSVQPDMVASTSSIREMADRMYNNMTNHSEFLDNVVQENLSECIRIINSQGDRAPVIGSMIFTLSLYNFFKINIPSESPSFGIIRDVFTVKERKVRSINPTSYMYFQQNVFIPNLYAMIEPYISGSTNVLNTKAKRDAVRKDVGKRIMMLNQQLMGLFIVPTRRSTFRNYIYFGWILALAFVVGIYSIYREEMDKIYDNFVKPFLNAINEFFWNIVMPWDIRSKKEENTQIKKE